MDRAGSGRLLGDDHVPGRRTAGVVEGRLGVGHLPAPLPAGHHATRADLVVILRPTPPVVLNEEAIHHRTRRTARPDDPARDDQRLRLPPDGPGRRHRGRRRVRRSRTGHAALLVEVAEQIVVPVTALCGTDPEPCDGSFALQAVGRVFVTTHNWAQAGPDTAKGTAQAVIRFTKEILTQDHEDIDDILRHMEAVGWWARPSMRTQHRRCPPCASPSPGSAPPRTPCVTPLIACGVMGAKSQLRLCPCWGRVSGHGVLLLPP